MSTPLKSIASLLSPRVLSPLSPRLLNSVQTTIRKKAVAKHLDFNNSKFGNKSLANPIQIHVTDFDGSEKVASRDILINTPNKKILLKKGRIENELVNVLGKGAFGTVIKGIYKESVVAVKTIKSTDNVNEKNALNLSHRNIIKTIEIVTNKSHEYSMIIMEYFPNSKQLHSILDEKNSKLIGKEIKYALDICEGLKFCHASNVLHLDLKPRNILVCDLDDTCKICDFGNSAQINSDNQSFHHQGTIAYTAPEILLGKFPTEKSDIYSLAIILWELKYKVNPYFGIDNNETIIYKVIKCGLRPTTQNYCENVYDKLFCDCWSNDPAGRPHLDAITGTLNSVSAI